MAHAPGGERMLKTFNSEKIVGMFLPCKLVKLDVKNEKWIVHVNMTVLSLL